MIKLDQGGQGVAIEVLGSPGSDEDREVFTAVFPGVDSGYLDQGKISHCGGLSVCLAEELGFGLGLESANEW
jgi:hypothetical protein